MLVDNSTNKNVRFGQLHIIKMLVEASIVIWALIWHTYKSCVGSGLFTTVCSISWHFLLIVAKQVLLFIHTVLHVL